MPFPNFHTARQKNPSGYDRIITKKNQGGPGIDFLIGFKGSTSDVTSIHFSSSKFSTAKARAWLKKHHFSGASFTSAKTQEGASMKEALARELSFDQIRMLFHEALCHEYPRMDEYGVPSYGCRYYVEQVWSDKALIRSNTWAAKEGDAKIAIVYFSIAEDKKSAEVTKSVPVQVVAMPMEDGEDSVVLDESALASDDELQEAGKRNSSKDTKKLNAAMRTLMDLMGDDDLEEETMNLMKKRTAAKKKKASEENEKVKTEHAASEIEEDEVKESGWDGTEGQTLTEQFSVDFAESKIDADNYVIKNTTILGPVSLNNRRYPESVMLEAKSLFEGAKAYLNHPEADSVEARNMRDFIGIHKNVRVVNGKMRSDLHLVKNETTREHVLAPAQTFPNAIGNSVVIRAVMERAKDGVDVAKKIVRVRSVDMVTEPGTTQGLFESHNPTNSQEETMEWKTISLESLKAERPDLIESLLADRKGEEERAKLQAEVERLAKENEEKDKKLAEHEIARIAAEQSQAMSNLVTEMKVPDAFKYEATNDGKRAIKANIKRMLERCKTHEEMEAVIKDWEETYATAQANQGTNTTISSESAMQWNNNAPKKVDLARIHAAITH